MVARSLLVKIMLRVILPLAVILVIVFGVTHFGFKQFYGIGLFESMRIERDVKQVIEEFMEAGAARDTEAVYACKYGNSAFEEGIVELIDRKYEYVFEGYRSLAINSISWVRIDIPVIVGDSNVKGKITYTSGKVRPFDAWMVEENGMWKIKAFRIAVHWLIRSIIPGDYYVEAG